MVSEHASPLATVGGVDAGGQNVHVADLARALGRLGAEVVVHTRRDDPALAPSVDFAPNVVVDHVDAGPAVPLAKDRLLPYMAEFSRELAAGWQVQRPDVVHSHFWMSGLAALRAARPLGLPVAHTFHALGVVKRRHQGPSDTSPPARIPVERTLALTTDRVVATTTEEALELVALGADLDRITVVPCGVDLERFHPEGPRAERRRPDRRRIVVVSRLVERKGIGNVIAAVAELPHVELVVAGGPPAAMLEDDEEARRFQRLATSLGIADRVELRGAVPREAVPALLRSADVVACCPWYEPFGLVAVEAMACGVPVVASAVGGLAETVVDGISGLLVPPRQPGRIAEALRRLLDDEPGRRAMGAAGLRRARRFDWHRIAEQTLEVAERLAATRARAGDRA